MIPASAGSILVLDAGDTLAITRHLHHHWPLATLRTLPTEDVRRAHALIGAARYELDTIHRLLIRTRTEAHQ